MEDLNVPNTTQGGTSPKSVTYSVSFCDNIPTGKSDSSRLLDGDDGVGVVDVSEVPALVVGSNSRRERSECINVPGRNNVTQELYSASVPEVSTNDNFRQAQGYGSLPFPSSVPGDGLSPPKRVIYCVHGNLTGCCMVADGELLEKGGGGGGGGGTILPAGEDKEPPTVISGEHCHRIRDEKVDQRARRKLILASVLCVLFMVGEIIATDRSNLITQQVLPVS
ncbi:Slc30a2_1 protein [Gryllus bimaculatus]|nr:Slc30a2_1 protein [Gryllus bimaculatus]